MVGNTRWALPRGWICPLAAREKAQANDTAKCAPARWVGATGPEPAVLRGAPLAFPLLKVLSQSPWWSDTPLLHPQMLRASGLRPPLCLWAAMGPQHWPCVCSTCPGTNAGHRDTLDKTGAKSLQSCFGLAGDTQLKTKLY